MHFSFLPREKNTCTYQFVEDELRDRRSLLGPSLSKSLDYQRRWAPAQSQGIELAIGLRNGLRRLAKLFFFFIKE